MLHVIPNCLMRLLEKDASGAYHTHTRRFPHAFHTLSTRIPVIIRRIPVSVFHMASACPHTGVRVDSHLAPFCPSFSNICAYCLLPTRSHVSTLSMAGKGFILSWLANNNNHIKNSPLSQNCLFLIDFNKIGIIVKRRFFFSLFVQT